MKKIKRVREQREMMSCEGCDARVDTWMIHCTECGEFVLGEEEGDTDCEECGRGIFLGFAFCVYCGTRTGEEAEPMELYLDGLESDEPCGNPSCEESITPRMLYCCYCGQKQDHEERFDDSCENCGTGAKSDWEHCAWCGAYGLMEKKSGRHSA